MIQATPHNGDPVVIVDTKIQSEVEDIMTWKGYGCNEYNLSFAPADATPTDKLLRYLAESKSWEMKPMP